MDFDEDKLWLMWQKTIPQGQLDTRDPPMT
jgi:hypothetical protein